MVLFQLEASTDGTNYQQLPLWSVRQNLPIGNTAAVAFSTGTLTQYLVNIAGYPYLQVRLVASITGAGTVAISYSLNAVGSEYAIQIVTPQMAALSDSNATSGLLDQAGVVRSTGVTVGFVTSGGAGPAVSFARTPSTFLSTPVVSGITAIFAPNSAKKARLMKYKFEVGEDCTISGGPTPVMLDWVWGTTVSNGNALSIAAVNSPYGSSTFGLTHRVVVPAAALATSGILWDSDWITLTNGVLPQFTNQSWGVAISVPQPITTAINPTWTIASNQWEAATIGFQTVGAAGGARVRAITQAIGVGSAVTVGISPKTGNTLIIGVRTTNIAAGAPTVTITDASGNSTSYTSLAQVTNASDGANGSTLQIFYTIGIKTTWNGSALTATTSTHVATVTEIIVVEVAGIVAVGGTSQASATGNSTSPAASNYAPAEAGDYIANFFASAANIASATVTPGLQRSYQNAAGGTIGFADNFANGALSAGAINVIASRDRGIKWQTHTSSILPCKIRSQTRSSLRVPLTGFQLP